MTLKLKKYPGRFVLLGRIDDLTGVSESGIKAIQLDAFVNIKTAEKKFQFRPEKCHTISVARKSV